jgi:hypothetical protein
LPRVELELQKEDYNDQITGNFQYLLVELGGEAYKSY